MTFRYGLDRMDLDIVNGIADGSIKAELCAEAIARINQSRNNVEVMASHLIKLSTVLTPVLARCAIRKSLRQKLRCCKKICLSPMRWGVGEPVAKAISKLMLITKEYRRHGLEAILASGLKWLSAC